MQPTATEPGAAEEPCVAEEPTATDLAAEEADARWMAGLTQSHTGKKLCDYLGHLTSVLEDGNLGVECPVDQACSFRRVLVRGLERSQSPFGLPKKLPNFIAMVQLCGERMLLTTQRNQLFQLLSHAPSGSRANSNAINAMVQMIKYRDEHPECTLLLTYSVPFQVDLAHMWWDVRTLRRDPQTLKVVDGEMAYQVGQAKCRSVGCTSALESETSTAMLEKETKAFEEHVSAVDLDMELLPPSDVSSTGETNKKVEALERVLASLTQERKKMIASHRTEIGELTKAKALADSAANEAAKLAYEAERESEESLNREVNRLAKQVESSMRTVAVHKQENELLSKSHRADMNAVLVRKDEELKMLQTKLTAAEASVKQITQELGRSNKSRDSAIKKVEREHTKSLDDLERKLQRATMAERAAKQEGEELLQRMASLSSAMEGRDAEKETLEHQLKNSRKANRVLRGALALSGVRREASSGDKTALASALARVDEINGQLKISELALNTAEHERSQMGEANKRLQARVEEADAELRDATAATKKPDVCDADTMTVPITSQAELDLGELQTAHVKVNDELAERQSEIVQLKADLTRARAKAAKRQVPLSFTTEEPNPPAAPVLGVPSASANGSSGGPYNIVTNVHVASGANTTAVASTDLGHAPDVDANVEHLIAQTANSLRILADHARDAARHKAAAHEGWAQVRALQNFSGYQVPPLPHPPMQPMHAGHLSPTGYMAHM